jgi:hypothetical protein
MSAATSPELHDRRQRAIEAYHDTYTPDFNPLEQAIEAATRVRIDKAVLTAAWAAYMAMSAPMEGPSDPDFYDMLSAAFEAAGFEVED